MSTPTTRSPYERAAAARTATRAGLAVLTAVLFCAAVYFAEIEFITAALLTGVAGVAVDLRQTEKLARARAKTWAGPTTAGRANPR
ncbi:hypothetical protein [Kocuria sp. SM24M-10]|uniref:hypothetical protein n=1 Tax=Kocuria sp. SM24M-10 TaxID=1660349 RepID=UPI00064B008D|nr:hypothetical protein [Kocuria sp. SM24M-10]KLU09151.1 hypothetical protein ABL57_13795 [Kocuria sp. SM24M-10]